MAANTKVSATEKGEDVNDHNQCLCLSCSKSRIQLRGQQNSRELARLRQENERLRGLNDNHRASIETISKLNNLISEKASKDNTELTTLRAELDRLRFIEFQAGLLAEELAALRVQLIEEKTK